MSKILAFFCAFCCFVIIVGTANPSFSLALPPLLPREPSAFDRLLDWLQQSDRNADNAKGIFCEQLAVDTRYKGPVSDEALADWQKILMPKSSDRGPSQYDVRVIGNSFADKGKRMIVLVSYSQKVDESAMERACGKEELTSGTSASASAANAAARAACLAANAVGGVSRSIAIELTQSTRGEPADARCISRVEVIG